MPYPFRPKRSEKSHVTVPLSLKNLQICETCFFYTCTYPIRGLVEGLIKVNLGCLKGVQDLSSFVPIFPGFCRVPSALVHLAVTSLREICKDGGCKACMFQCWGSIDESLGPANKSAQFQQADIQGWQSSRPEYLNSWKICQDSAPVGVLTGA